MKNIIFPRVTVIGGGLIGSSAVRALKKHKLCTFVTVADGNPDVCARIMELGIADNTTTDLPAAVKDADLIMFCTPVGTFENITKKIAPHLKPGAVVSDTGSVKSAAVTAVAKHLPKNVHFIPAHPIAGTENSGPDAGFAHLFEERWLIITPLPEYKNNDAYNDAKEKLKKMWTSFGSNVTEMDAAHHDKVLAITSHLPHLIAYTIVSTAADLEHDLQEEVIKFSASGFRDFTRIASSDPIMWRDIFLTNRDSVLEIIQRFTEDLTALQRAIRSGDGDTLQTAFTRTRAVRKAVIEQGQAVPEEYKKIGKKN